MTIAQQKLFPVLSGNADTQDSTRDGLPLHEKDDAKKPTQSKWKARLSQPTPRKLASLVFSASIGLSAVLVELLLCEVSNILHPAARALALRLTLGSLLLLVIVITPALEIHGFARVLFGEPRGTSARKSKRSTLRRLVEIGLLLAWLVLFWYIPQASILRKSLKENEKWRTKDSNHFSEKCLERVGIIGISLMASLSGFAAVSSLWQTFGARHRTVAESEVLRKHAGLNVTEEMLAAKQSRVRALQLRLQDSSAPAEQGGIFGRMMGAFRGSKEATELRMLQMEVSGLETVRFTLSNSLATLQSRFADQERSKTRWGKAMRLFNTLFAVYCAYRIGATTISLARRWWQPTRTVTTSDPINNILTLLTAHWDSELDRAAWSRQFSFLLSGVILLASFSAVLQTFRLFARFAPGLVQHTQTSLPLIISQVAGTYVIASAILLGSNLPSDMSSIVRDALGAPLEGKFVERWFESWFLVAVGVTVMGIAVSRRFDDDGSDSDWAADSSSNVGAGKHS